MDNSFFIMSEMRDGKTPVTITRLQICTWNIVSGNASLEIGIEIKPNTLPQNQECSIVFFTNWPTEGCNITSLHDKFTKHDNVRFVFNETDFTSGPIDEQTHNGSRIVFNEGSQRILAILPAKAEKLENGVFNLSFKNKAKEDESPYLRVMIKTPLNTLAMVKNGIAQNTYIFDVKFNERRNLPKRFSDIVDTKNLTYCLIENVFCLHVVPTSFEISFIDSAKLKNIRQLEKTALKTYLPEIELSAKEDYIITFSKYANPDKTNYSFFCAFSQEAIGTTQIFFAIAMNIFCSLLFAFAELRKFWNSQLPWYRQISGEYYIALVFLIVFVCYICKRIKAK